ncbi:hypothetical protein QMW88_00105 [Cronobacter dublinensis]|uniref:hypothetical protein n=1 Tax=Cronobacter dublinensis TaxID=413497 RepID=UPI0024C3EF51|nr:hypothetical protein [Cronobacter dublinensis]MDK1193894.1 hypothetical protein [Cronobacter dublinensis]MDK1199683.1 hypothetical protein [Cronobacter dublinensis]
MEGISMSYGIKLASLFICVMPLTGCIIASNTLDDYSGKDSAMIRLENYMAPLSLQVYRQVGTCVQQVDNKSLTAAVNILGIKSTYNKKVPAIATVPGSSPLNDKDVLEYAVQPNQLYKIGYQTTSQTTYSTSVYSSYRSFKPQPGHSYEVYTLAGGYYIHGIMITDITQGKDEPAPEWTLKECDYDLSMLGQKVYHQESAVK